MSCRVTVVGTRRRLDADLPDSIAVAEILGDIVGLLGEHQDGAAVEWGLLRVGGARLDPELSLAEQGIADGTMLFLRDVTAAPIAPDVADFAGHVAATVDVQKGRWSQALVAPLLTWLSAVAIAAAGLVVLTAGDASSRSTAGVLGVLIAGGAALAVTRFLRRRDLARVLMFGSLPSWAAAGAGMASLATAGALMAAAFALAGAALGAIAVGAIAGEAALAATDGVVESTAVPAVVVGIAAALGAGLTQAAAALVVVELAILATMPVLLPRLLLAQRLAQGRGVMTASRIASALVIFASCAVLATSGGWFARALVAATAVATIVRARHYRFAGEVVPLLAAGIAAAILLELPLAVWLAVGARGALGLALLLAGDAFVLVAAAVLVRRWDVRPAVARWLPPLEYAAVALSVPLALGVFGLYDGVVHYAATLR